MDFFWLIPLVLIVLVSMWSFYQRVKIEGGEPLNTPQGPVPRRKKPARR